jgi:hypothetical protein
MIVVVTNHLTLVQASWSYLARFVSDSSNSRATGAVTGVLGTCSQADSSGGKHRYGWSRGPGSFVNVLTLVANSFSSQQRQRRLL